MSDIIIGIDLGTTYSAVAYVDDAEMVEVIPNREGKATTPSVVLVRDGQFVVGQEVAAIGQLLDLALDQPALAGRATADPATVGEIDTLAQGRLQQGFLRIDRDRLRVDVRSDDAWRGRCLLGKERKHVCSVESNGQTGSLIMVCGMRRGKEVGD